MKLTLLRHGEAQPMGSCTMDADQKRPLTARGRLDISETFSSLSFSGEPLEIWASPFLRTRQTAEIVKRYLRAPVKIAEYLTVTNSSYLMRALQTMPATVHVVVVTHEPFIGDMVNRLTGERPYVHTGDFFTIALDEDLIDGELVAWRRR